MTPHRWSGWPGAWCLDCGVEDAGEVCVAEHSDGLTCEHGHVMCEVAGHQLRRCAVPEHNNGPCLAPGAKLADPYTTRALP